jgi:nucleoid-associated protein YgaU
MRATIRRTRDVVKGLVAVAATLALVVGLPLALVAVVGNPLPGQIPSWDGLRGGLERSSVQAEVIINVLAVVLWVVWARLSVAVLGQTVATLRGRGPLRPPSGIGLQSLAANLVTSITLLSALLPARMAVAAPLAASVAPPPAVSAPAPPEEPMAPGTAPSPATSRTSAPASTTYETGSRDSWWSIAESALGEGLRWAEVRDLNVGRTMPDGHVIAADDHLLGKGWTVLVPTGEAVPEVATAQLASAEVVVAPGDTLWDIAEAELGDPFAWSDVYDANTGVQQSDGQALRDPDLILPGWRLSLGTDGATASQSGQAPAPAPPAASEAPPGVVEEVVPTPAPSAEADTAPATTAPAAGAPRRERPLRAPSRSAPAAPAQSLAPPAPSDTRSETGLGAMAAEAAVKVAVIGVPALAATGVVLRLGLLRALQQRRRRPQRGLPRPEPALEPLERHLRAIAVEEGAEWVELVMRLLTLRMGEAGYDRVPKVVVLRAGEFGVEVMLDQPCSSPPEGFEAEEDARVWRLVSEMELEELRALAASAPVISPALVTLGLAPEGPVLVDLETLGVLSVEGDEQRVRAFLAGAALELATASWSELELAVLDDDLGVTPLERGSSCADADELVRRVRSSVGATTAALDTLASTAAARVAESDADPWPPVVAVVGPDRRGEAADRVARVLGTPGRGGALVAAGPVRDATWRLSISADAHAVLSPLGLEVDVTGVDVEALAGASRLLEVAAEEGDNAPLVDLVAEGARHHRQGDVADEPVVDDVPATLGQQRLLETPEPGEIHVRVLGRPEVSGWASPASNKAAEIVAYLAVHDAPVPTERLRNAIWPLRDNRFTADDAARQTQKSAMYRTRRALGVDAEGNAHLPPTAGGVVGVGPKVRCDWHEFRALVRQAQHQPRPAATASLRSGLELVRGAPFSYVGDKAYAWGSSEQFASEMEIAIGDAAHRLCELALSQGDDELAMWATGQGLLASPGQEALVRDRMTAAAAGGELARLRGVLQDAQQAVHAIDPLDELCDETMAHYEELSARLVARGA